MRQYLILDVGTSSVRAALIDETLRILRLETARRTAPALFDAEAEWTLLRALMKAAASGAGDLAGVAVSALLGWVGTDARGNAVTPCFTYMHACPEEYAASPWDAEKAYRVCRRAPAPESGCFQLARVKARDPEAYGRTTAFLSLKDFINGKLTGAFATDATTAAYTLLYDVGAGRWSVRALEALGLERDKLPPLSVPGAALAPLSPALCRELGLSQAPPVAVGSVDGSTGILGAGGLEEGDVVSVMGTTDVFFAVQAHPCEDRTRRLLVNPHVAAGRWLIGGPMGMYGGALDWFSRDLLGGSRPLSELDALAEAVPPGSEGVTFLPTLAGERTPFWRPAVEGTVRGLRPCHRAEHLHRAMMEANCYANRRILDLVRENGLSVRRVLAIGGGAASDVWLQMKADVLGLPVFRTAVKEASLAGACMLAMQAAGAGLSELPRPGVEAEFAPRPQPAARYDALYLRFLADHEAMAALYDSGAL